MRNTHKPLRFRSFIICAFIFFSSVFYQKSHAQVPGTSLHLDGVDDYVTLPNGIVTGVTGDFTIETWIYWRGGGFWQRILDIGVDQNSWIALVPSSTAPGNPARFGIMLPGFQFQFVDAAGPLPTDTWTHVAVTLNAATGDLRFFVNGNPVGLTPNVTHRLSDVTVQSNNRIGESKYPDAYLNGVVDELRISNVVRYTAAFTPQTTAFTPDAATVAYYRFEEGSGQTAASTGGTAGTAILGATTAAETSDPLWVNSITLPVRLVAFNGVVRAREVELTWSATLDDASFFEVQRSNDGGDFQTIGTVSGNRTSGTITRFSFTDVSPRNGKNLYRLRYWEVGGRVYHSRTIVLNTRIPATFTAYPNPAASGQVFIKLDQPVSGNTSLRLYNVAGALIHTQVLPAGIRQVPLTMLTQKGVYTVCLNTEEGISSQVVIVQ